MLIRSLVFLASTLSVWSMPYASDLDEGSTFLQNLKRGTCPSTSAYDAFIHHFSADRSSTEIRLQTQFTALYPNSSVVVTDDPTFDLLRYASASEDPIVIKEIETLGSIKRVRFQRALRRRDGDGVVGDTVAFAGYEVAWGEHEFVAIVATWRESYQYITQWHLIGDDPSAAHALIRTISAWYSALHEAILVFDQSSWHADHSLWLAVQQASWDDVILGGELKSAVTHDYRTFFRSEEVYKNLQVPWKRGLIFLGPPGNGKTISLKAIMKEVKVPVLYVKTFHTYAGDEFGIRQIFQRARAEAPCVLVLEDLDSLITDMNRSFFLNEVDGLEDNDGLLLIGTTNHFERLDPALSNRPSRFDRKYNFPNPSQSERRQYAVYWQDKLRSNEEIDFPDSLLDDFAAETDKFSFAYMKEAFVSTLLTLAGRDTISGGGDFGKILIEQIQHLREELEAGSVESMAASWEWASERSARQGSGMEMAHSDAFEAEAYRHTVLGEEAQRIMMFGARAT